MVSHSLHRFSQWDVSVSAYITFRAVVFTIIRISVSAHVTLCALGLAMRRISVSVHITFWAVFSLHVWGVYRYQPISHSVQCLSLWGVYRYQPISHWLFRVFVSMLAYRLLIVRENKNIFHFCATWERTAQVKWIRYSPKGSNLIHWTCAAIPCVKWTCAILFYMLTQL